MDINESLNSLVDTLSKQILDKVQSQVEGSLRSAILDQLSKIDIQGRVDAAANAAAVKVIDKYTPDLGKIESQINSAAATIVSTIDATAKSKVNTAVQEKVLSLDFDKLASERINSHLDAKVKHYSFPDGSIPVTAIGFTQAISGDNIDGGIIKNFGSTGIDDKATDCRLTILDEHTVFENTLLATGLTIKGPTVLEGDLTIRGTIPETSPAFQDIVKAAKLAIQSEIDTALFVEFSDTVFAKIKKDGLDLSKITLNGNDVMLDNALTNNITESNLQKLGVLRELQVKGESLFNNSVYISDKRLGINTLEPAAVLSIWDEEVEVQVSKKRKDVAYIGAPRYQTVILSSNNKDNLMLNTDGSVSVQALNLGKMSFGTAATAPTNDAPKGTVLFNENPSLGGPLGWVSLGDARWANFGIID